MSDQTTDTPVLETDRLILRSFREEDVGPLFAINSQPAVYQHISGQPTTREETWRKLMAFVGHWALLGYGYLAVEDKASGKFAGLVGLADFKRDMMPSLEGTLEAGWTIDPAFQGKGYAGEAMGALLQFGKATFPDKKVTCIISVGNEASFHLAKKLGFVERCTVAYHDGQVVVFDYSG